MSHDASAPVAKRGQQNAVENARQRLTEVRVSSGVKHPDYASALIQLALLLIMHGDPTEAEPLLREALIIRRDTLGERHPDYATCLSSLAGLLWARGDLDAAEPLLRQALAIRSEVLGERHPKSVVSQNSLDQLVQAKKAWDSAATLDTSDQAPSAPATPMAEVPPHATEAISEPAAVPPRVAVTPEAQPEPEPVPAVEAPAQHAAASAPPSEPETAAAPGRSREELAFAVEELAEAFAGLGGQLHSAIGALKEPGVVPADSLVKALRESRTQFTALRGEVLDLAARLGMPDVGSIAAGSLNDLGSLLAELERYELEQSRSGQVRRQALATLERVARLGYSDPKDFPPLRELHDTARTLHQSIEASHPSNLPAEASALADGSHPYNALLALADVDAGLNDEEWANALETVQTHLGKTLSVAAARAKIVAGPAA